MYLRQDFRAPRKNRLRRQFLNSLRSNRRNCHPPYPSFTSCGPSCSNKSLKYNHGRRSLSRSLALLLLNSGTLSRTLRDSRDSCSISVLSLSFLCYFELCSLLRITIGVRSLSTETLLFLFFAATLVIADLDCADYNFREQDEEQADVAHRAVAFDYDVR